MSSLCTRKPVHFGFNIAWTYGRAHCESSRGPCETRAYTIAPIPLLDRYARVGFQDAQQLMAALGPFCLTPLAEFAM
jgi:hypothetical protein